LVEFTKVNCCKEFNLSRLLNNNWLNVIPKVNCCKEFNLSRLLDSGWLNFQSKVKHCNKVNLSIGINNISSKFSIIILLLLSIAIGLL
jgi:hypothetical protein